MESQKHMEILLPLTTNHCSGSFLFLCLAFLLILAPLPFHVRGLETCGCKPWHFPLNCTSVTTCSWTGSRTVRFDSVRSDFSISWVTTSSCLFFQYRFSYQLGKERAWMSEKKPANTEVGTCWAPDVPNSQNLSHISSRLHKTSFDAIYFWELQRHRAKYNRLCIFPKQLISSGLIWLPEKAQCLVHIDCWLDFTFSTNDTLEMQSPAQTLRARSCPTVLCWFSHNAAPR